MMEDSSTVSEYKWDGEDFVVFLNTEKIGVVIRLILDPNWEDEPQIEIDIPKGYIEPRLLQEFNGFIQDLTEPSHFYSSAWGEKKFMSEVLDWFYYRFGDEDAVDEELNEEIEAQEAERSKKQQEEKQRREEEKHQAKQAAIRKRIEAERNAREKMKNALAQQLKVKSYGELREMRQRIQREEGRRRRERQERETQQLHTMQASYVEDGIQKLLSQKGITEEMIHSLPNHAVEVISYCFQITSNSLSVTKEGINQFPGPILNAFYFITELNLVENNLSELPESVNSLSHLRNLKLSYNQFSCFPEIFGLDKLIYLDLDFNQITSIPSKINQLVSLQYLDLERNRIKQYPYELTELPDIEHVNLNSNRITLLPPELGFTESLKKLRLWNNPIRMISPEAAQRGTRAILNALREFIPSNINNGLHIFSRQLLKYSQKHNSFAEAVIVIGDHIFPVNLGTLFYRAPKIYDMIIQVIRIKNSRIDDQKRPMLILYESVEDHLIDVYATIFRAILNYIYSHDPGFDSTDQLFETYPDIRDQTFLQVLQDEAATYGIQGLVQMCDNWSSVLVDGVSIDDSEYNFGRLLLASGEHSDLLLKVDGEILCAHRFILAARSPFFKRMFESDFKESQDRSVTFTDISLLTMKDILEFIYTGDIKEFNDENVIELLMYSAIYQLPGLTHIMESIVGFAIDVDNVACILEISLLYECERLSNACLFYIITSWNKVRYTDAWKESGDGVREAVKNKATQWETELRGL
eukprot:TRINITY_DN6248_c0_g1_i1.p1 TRINITY_DN6248_c0_g1~~TRINITY_DN6248_c0_g1_i1.p1  ORF type:complete len:753 (-),score=146.98 TRINITY_DN6248_c0_g1_i1:51-2309(-)